jgi:hypothetical protein
MLGMTWNPRSPSARACASVPYSSTWSAQYASPMSKPALTSCDRCSRV